MERQSLVAGYRVVLEHDDNGTVMATVPDLPEVVTFGDDEQDALARVVDAIETAMDARLADEGQRSLREHETIPASAVRAALKTLPFDAADALDTQEAQAELLDEALAIGDAKVVAAALGMIARAKGETDEKPSPA